MIILTSSIEFKLINFFHIKITIIRLSFWTMSNFRKVEHIKCFHISSKRSRNISSKICLKILSRLKKFRISHRCYLQWKLTKNLRFCVDYRKFNVMTKRNRYSLFLIKEIIKKIIECKHFIKLNIIVVFNKFRMHLDNENYTTFITTLNIYKYRVLSFDLINELSSFQQYINDAL